MTHTIDQFQNQRDIVLQDAAMKLATGDRDALLQQAIVQRYSKDRSREIVTDMPGLGTSFVNMPASTPDSFEDGFSIIKSVEYPIGQVPLSLVLEENWQIYRAPAPTGLQVLFIANQPMTSEVVRFTWTARHKPDGSTVPDVDFEAVCDYAAGLSFAALAAIYTQTGDATIMADSVNYRTKGQEYAGLAKAAAKRYFDHVGVAADDKAAQAGPAIATGSMHELLGMGLDRLTHRKASR
jgi:hypothetical protein